VLKALLLPGWLDQNQAIYSFWLATIELAITKIDKWLKVKSKVASIIICGIIEKG